ncbi:MAG: ABC transporter substrate-binding protein [Thermodesulfobacteriaceae bacterium]|nr:ABC transporter substrate-binding protein [Thermodesulfobacteriaceae bacterium]MDW8136478.1 ABC transporter substrate-binding protein [Thermodesulfobacterium sp.]
MVSRIVYKILIGIFIWIGVGFTSTFTVIDKLERKITVEVPVKRAIIAITPELIPALDIWNQVVGVSDWAEKTCSVYKAFVFNKLKAKKPTVGTGTNLNVEAILKLNPDIVITWSYNTEVIRFLEERGVKVIAIWPESISELYEVIRLHGKLFGKEKRAEELIKEMENLFNLIRLRVAKIPYEKRKKVLHLGGKPTTVSGKLGVTHDVIELIGGINVGAEINERNAEVSIERIIKWNPEVIFIWGGAGYDENQLYNNSQWKFIKAVRNQQIYKLPRWSTWSPRLAPIALYMAIKVYPQIFQDINFEEKIDNFYKKNFGVSYYVVKKYERY